MGLQMPPAGTALGSATWPHRRQHAGLDEVRYAHPDGSNTRDGLTWGTAKQDVVAAFDALPVTGGTIYVANSVFMDSVNTDRGLWLVGPNDPSYASPPTGFRQQKRLRLVGGGLADHGATGHVPMAHVQGGSTTDRAKPALWLAGTDTPFSFENLVLKFPAVAVRLGMRSDGTNAVVNTAAITFRDCAFAVNQIAGNGPTIELGYCYWLWFYDCVVNGNPNGKYTPSAASIIAGTTARFTIGTHALVVGDTVFVSGMTPAGYNGLWTVSAVAATTFDADIGTSPAAGSVMGLVQPVRHYRRSAIGHDTVDRIPGATPSGLIHVLNSNFNGGGFHYMPSGATSSGRLTLENLTYEGDFGSNPQQPALHVRAAYGAASMPDACSAIHVANVELADGNFVDGAVLVDGIATQPYTVTVENCSATGNVLQISGLAPSRRAATLNAAGSWGHSPAAVRAFGSVPVPYTNLFPQDATTWPSLGGDGTITTGKAAPDGTTNAARLSGGSANRGADNYRAGHTFAVGDWVIAGVWRRFHSGTSPSDNNLPIISSVGGGAVTFENGSTAFVLRRPTTNFTDDGGWCWFAEGYKAISGGGSGELIMQLRVAAASSIDYYAPVIVRVPVASVVDDDDMRDFVRYFRTWPDTSPAGAVSTLRGQKFIAWGGLGVGNSAAATTPGSVVKKMEVFSETGASLGFVPIYSTIT